MLKNGFSVKLVAAYCHLIVHSMMSVFVDKQKANMCNWFKYTYLSHVLRRPGEALDLIEKTHWSPNSWCVSMHMLSLEDDSPVSGLKASWHIFLFLAFLLGPACMIRLLSMSINEQFMDSAPWWSSTCSTKLLPRLVFY